jgi:hypothetical protein
MTGEPTATVTATLASSHRHRCTLAAIYAMDLPHDATAVTPESGSSEVQPDPGHARATHQKTHRGSRRHSRIVGRHQPGSASPLATP